MPTDRFFGNYATAMLTWQSVENALYSFFFSLFDGNNLTRTGAVFYSQESFSAKLRLADAAAKVTLNEEQLSEWNDLMTRMRKLSGERNVLAHHTAVADFGENLRELKDLVLLPPLFVPGAMIKARKRKYDAAGCGDLIDEFSQLAEDLNSFTKRKGW